MFNALISTESPSPLTQLIDYGTRVDGQPLYMGFANKGTTQDMDGWVIQFFQYTTIGSNDYLVSRTASNGVWSNRANLTYG